MNQQIIKAPGGFGTIVGGTKQTPALGTEALLDGYTKFPWIRAIADKIGQEIGGIDWQLFFNDQEVEGNPLLDLLNRPNPSMDRVSFFKLAGKHMTLTSEVFWLIERSGTRMPVELWPLSPSWIKDIPSPGEEQTGSYEIQAGRWRTRFPAEDIIYIRDLDPLNPYGRSSSPARALGDEIEADEFAAKYIKSFFINNARPDLLIYSEDSNHPLGKEDAERLEIKWNAKLQGIRNRFKAFFLSGKVGIKELQASLKDMDLTNQRKFWRDMIIQVYGLPPEILGIVESSNRATISAAEFFLTKHVIVPIADTILSGMQLHLAPQFDERLRLGYVSPVQEDREHKSKVYKDHSWAFERDEIRKLAGDEPLDGDPVYASPFNLVFSSEPGGQGIDRSSSLTEPVTESVDDINKDIVKIDDDDIDDITRVLGIDEFSPGVNQSNSATVEGFGQSLIDQVEVGIDFDLSSPEVQDFLETQSTTRIKDLINPTTRKALQRTLSQGSAAGEGAAELAKRITKVFDTARASRAFRIARTESVRAANFGSLTAMDQVGIKKKQWLTVGDSNVRSSHVGLNGDIVDVNKEFTTVNGTAQYPGGFGIAAEDIECRCSILAVIDNASFTLGVKTFEQDRLPFEELIEDAYVKGFDAQEVLVLAALKKI